MQVIKTLKSVSGPFSSKNDMMQQLFAKNLSKPIVHWMTTNLRPRKDGSKALEWKFDIDCCSQLMHDYALDDMSEDVENLAAGAGPQHQLHIVRATRSDRFTEEELRRLGVASSTAPDRVYVHEIEAGHWCHVDNPEDLFSLLAKFTLNPSQII